MTTPKKVREWYQSYRTQCKDAGIMPLSLKLWATLESEKREGTPRGKVLARFVAARPPRKRKR